MIQFLRPTRKRKSLLNKYREQTDKSNPSDNITQTPLFRILSEQTQWHLFKYFKLLISKYYVNANTAIFVISLRTLGIVSLET